MFKVEFKICDFELHRTPHLKYAFRTSSTALSELAQKRLSLMRSQSFKNRFNRQKIPQGIFRAPRFSKLTQKKARRGAFTAGSNFRPPFFTSLFTHQETGNQEEALSAKKGEKSPFSCPAPLTFWARCGIILPWVLWAFLLPQAFATDGNAPGAVGKPQGNEGSITGQKTPPSVWAHLLLIRRSSLKREVQILLLLSPF